MEAAHTPMRGVPQPTAEDVRRHPRLHVSDHPLVAHKLTRLRSVETGVQEFHELIGELSWLLAYEALADLALRPAPIRTPLEAMEGVEPAETIGLVPILRAGLGMVEGFRRLLPGAPVWHLGLVQDAATRRPVEYYNRLPGRSAPGLCLVLDPMLATGASATRAIAILREWGTARIKVVALIAAPYGVDRIVREFPEVHVHAGALDRVLNDQGYILPGLGDAGDRQFGTDH